MIEPYETLDQLHQAAADAFSDLAVERVRNQGVFSVSLSGGSTPRRLYELLAKRNLPWSKIHWFWGDERNVPHDHDDSNFRMVARALLDHVSCPQENIHAVPVNLQQQPAEAARLYELELQKFFAGQALPVWDLVLLGMGDDAHTASLFPNTSALGESERWFVDNWVEKYNAYRYTLTAPAINSAREIWFLVSGQAKQAAMTHVLADDDCPQQYPSRLIKPTRWFVTSDAMES